MISRLVFGLEWFEQLEWGRGARNGQKQNRRARGGASGDFSGGPGSLALTLLLPLKDLLNVIGIGLVDHELDISNVVFPIGRPEQDGSDNIVAAAFIQKAARCLQQIVDRLEPLGAQSFVAVLDPLLDPVPAGGTGLVDQGAAGADDFGVPQLEFTDKGQAAARAGPDVQVGRITRP